jgi:hypothetical protein
VSEQLRYLIIYVSALPLDWAQSILLMCMLPMKHKWVFLGVSCFGGFVMMAFRVVWPVLPVWLQVPVMLIHFFIVPFLFYDDSYGWRIAALGFAFVGNFIPEIVGAGVWPLLSNGAPTASMEAAAEYLPQHLITKLIFLLVIAIVGSILVPGFRKMRSMGSSTGVTMFAGFVFVQGVLIFLSLLVGTRLLASDAAFQLDELWVSGVCVGADILLLAVMARSGQREVAAAKEETLRKQLDWQLAGYRHMAEEIEASSRLRHDFRNQLQTVEVLAAQGDYADAERTVRELRRRLEVIGGNAS